MLRSGLAVRKARAEQIICAVRDWQRGRISCVALANLCICTNSEWLRIWGWLRRQTPDDQMCRRVYRVMRAGKWGAP